MLLHYKKLGSGSPLFIMHGVFGMLDNWMSLGKRWAEDYEVYLIDVRNHGKSDHSDVMNYDVMAADIYELARHLDLEKIAVLGHSMGGKIAMKLAMLYPELVAQLIVIDIGPKAYVSGHDHLIAALSDTDLSEFSSRSAVDRSLRERITNMGVRQFLLKNLYWKEKGVLDFRMNLPVISKNMDAIVASVGTDIVDTETLFLRGLESDYMLDEDLPIIEDQFTSSEIVDVENAGHWIHAQAPDTVFDLVSEFLAK